MNCNTTHYRANSSSVPGDPTYGDIVFGAPAIPGTPVINAPGVTVTLTTTNGSIYDNNDNQTPNSTPIAPLFVRDVVAGTIILNAPRGSVGEIGDTIEITAANVSATAGTTYAGPQPGTNAAVSVQRTVQLWSTSAIAVNTITDAGGPIDITSEGSMTVNGPVTQSTGHDITLFATGAASDLTLVGLVSATDSGGPLGGDITLQAGDQVILGGASSIITEGNSLVTLNAGWPDFNPLLPNNPSADLVLSGTLNLGASDLLLTAPRHVILDGGSADITTTGGLTVFADRDNSAIGTGGTFIQNSLDSTVQVSSADITAADIQLVGIIDAGNGDIEVTTENPASNIYINNIQNLPSQGMNISLADLLSLRTDGGTITIGKDYDTGTEVTGTIVIGGLGTVGVGLINADYEIFGGLIDFNGGIVVADNRKITLDSDTSILTAGSGFVDVTARGLDGTLVVRAGLDATLSTIVTNLGTMIPAPDPTIVGRDFVLNNNNFDLDVAAPVTAASVTLTTGTAALTVSQPITTSPAAGTVLTITADGLALNADISGGGLLTIRGSVAASTIGFGNSAAGQLNLNNAEVAHLIDGFTQINIGYDGQTGRIDFVAPVGGFLTFHDPIRINASTVVGSVEVKDGTVLADTNGSFNITAQTLRFLPLATLPVPSSVLAGLQTSGGPIDLFATTILGIDTHLTSNGGSIRTFGTIDGNFDLTVNAGTGPVLINGNPTAVPTGTSVGGTTALSSITVTGGLVELRPNMKTSGPQTYNGTDIQLIGGAFRSNNNGAVLTPGDITFNGPVTLQNNIAVGTTNSAVTFNGTVNNIADPTTVAGKGALRIDTVGGAVTFADDVGAGFALKSVDITSAGIVTIGNDAGDSFRTINFLNVITDELDMSGSVTVPAGAITVKARSASTPILIGGVETVGSPSLELSNADVAALADGAASILIGRQLGNAPITIGAPVTFLDPVTFQQPAKVGGVIQIDAQLTGDTANGGFVFRGPATRLNSDIITTGGGAVDVENPVVVASLATIDTAAGGGNVTLRGTLRGAIGGEDLTITTGTGAITVTTGVTTAVGTPVMGTLTLTSAGNTRIDRGLTVGALVTDGGGTTFLKGRITTTEGGGQSYLDPVQLIGNADLHSRSAAGVILFFDTVDSDLAQPTKLFNLSVTNRVVPPTGITAQFDDAIGQTQRLGGLRVNTTGDTIFNSAADIDAKSVVIRAASFTVQDVDTTTSQAYNGAGTFLGTINAAKLTITSAVDIVNNAAWTVTGLATFNAGHANVNVSGGGNQFGELTLRGADASVEEDGNMALRYASLSGTLALTTHQFGLEDGDLGQTTSRTGAKRFEADVAGDIAINRKDTRFSEIGSVTAGGSIELLVRGPRYILLQGPITATGDIILAADPLGTAGSFRTNGQTISITSSTGRFVVYSYYAAYSGDGTDLRSHLAGLNGDFSGRLHPDAPPATGNVLMYFRERA